MENSKIVSDIKKAMNKLSFSLKRVEGVYKYRNLASYFIYNVYFKNVYGKSSFDIKKEMDIDEKSSILHFMPYLDCESMLVAIRYINNFVMSKMGCSYETIKKTLFDVVNDISLESKVFLKEKKQTKKNRKSLYTYLKEAIYENKDEIYDEDLISNEEYKLLKQEKEREKFYKEQQAFIEYEEKVHKRR